MASCPRCGEKGTGWFKLCGRCEMAVTISTKPDPKKNPLRPIPKQEDDE